MQSSSLHNSLQQQMVTNNSLGGSTGSMRRSNCFSRNPALSEARRSFFLITIFDLSFMILLWLIYITTRGFSLYDAYESEIVNYNVEVSLFDVVILSLARFLLLAIIYVFVRLVNWIPVAFITFSSSSFLIIKVVLFAMKGTHKIITDYVILIVSFVIAWIEVWYLEVKIFSPERTPYVQFTDVEQQNSGNHNNNNNNTERDYGSLNRRAISDIASFYSPLDSPNDSDNEGEATTRRSQQQQLLPDFSNLSQGSQAKEYELLAREDVKKCMEMLDKKDGWKLDKEYKVQKHLSINDDAGATGDDRLSETRIFSQSFKIGKVFKLEATLKFSDNLILRVLRDEVEKYPLWNKSVNTTKVLHRYNQNLTIVYSSVHEQAAGLVAPRDFVNLSSYAKINDMHLLTGSACVHASMPTQEGFVRGENGPTGYIIRPVNKTTSQIIWLLNVNLKGWLPQYLIDQSLSAVQIDFITSLVDYLKKTEEQQQ